LGWNPSGPNKQIIPGTFPAGGGTPRAPNTDLFAPRQRDDGRYDLDRWNDAYWQRLRFFLDETHKRQIIVQLTLWDWFDLSGGGRFTMHPLNPENNINWEPGTIKNAADSTSDRCSGRQSCDCLPRFLFRSPRCPGVSC
jgi:hypothetical protein